MAHTQANRHIAIATPLGPDVLLLEGFRGSEGISELFRFELDLLAELDRVIDFDAIVGSNVTLRLKTPTGERFFNGIVSRFSEGASDETFTTYHAEMVPTLWLGTQTADCRIFQFQKPPEIIERVLTDLGITDVRLDLARTYPVREYCVQYRETAFNFIARLMEQYGIFYYFEHENGKHTLVLADDPAAHAVCPGQARARFHRPLGAAVLREDVVTGLQREQVTRPGKYALTDYNFETPAVSLDVNVESQGSGPKFEIYDYPGEYPKRAEGEQIVRVRIEAEEAQRVLIDGQSTCGAFSPGFKFTLAEHPRAVNNAAYILTRVSHRALETTFRSGADDDGFRYDNRFSCIPGGVSYRPPRRTPMPVVEGPQTAEVVGVPGEEIYTDKFGRVHVQFHWDRVGVRDEGSSCWIRVSQPWAGKNWGAIFLPRVGQEVIVDFLEGDPDQPIIIGRVYNGEQMPPYELPANQTQSGIKTRSSPGGDPSNFNELRFEDKKGQEQIYLHAEKTLTTVVEGSESRSVGGSRSTTVGKDDVTTVKKGDRTTTIEEGNDSLTITKGKRDTTIKGDDTLTLQSGNRKVLIQSGNDSLVVSAGNIDVSAPAGKYSLTAKQVAVTGAVDITLTCGASSIKLTPAMIVITAPVVKINC
jgi:type VI secretion system secreted protein VgrG